MTSLLLIIQCGWSKKLQFNWCCPHTFMVGVHGGSSSNTHHLHHHHSKYRNCECVSHCSLRLDILVSYHWYWKKATQELFSCLHCRVIIIRSSHHQHSSQQYQAKIQIQLGSEVLQRTGDI